MQVSIRAFLIYTIVCGYSRSISSVTPSCIDTIIKYHYSTPIGLPISGAFCCRWNVTKGGKMKKYFSVVMILVLVSCSGGDSSSGSGVNVSNDPITGAIQNEPWNGTWQLQSVGGADKTGENMQMTLSAQPLELESGLSLQGRYLRIMVATYVMTIASVKVSSDYNAFRRRFCG